MTTAEGERPGGGPLDDFGEASDPEVRGAKSLNSAAVNRLRYSQGALRFPASHGAEAIGSHHRAIRHGSSQFFAGNRLLDSLQCVPITKNPQLNLTHIPSTGALVVDLVHAVNEASGS